MVLDVLVWSPAEGTAGHPIWGLLGQASVPVFGNQALDWQELGEERRRPGMPTSMRRGLKDGSGGGRKRAGWGAGEGAVVLSDKSSSTVPPTMENWGQKLDWRRFRR